MTTPESNRPLTGDGWIEWTGGENPVPGQMVEIRRRDGFETCPQSSDGARWTPRDAPDQFDIIAYRLARPTQPKPERDGAVERVRQLAMGVRADRTYGAGRVPASRMSEDLRHVLSLLSTAERQRDEAMRALEFYADERRYDGANQRRSSWPEDPFTAEDAAYLTDSTRDGGSIARQALQSIGSGE